ncbi:MAG: hypothetical protein FWF55_07240, partial [Treponema sp.]|nr:hypothetical protein [Treponema sp.]
MKPQPVLFPVQGTDQVLFGLGREAAEGLFDLGKIDRSKPKRFEYRFAAAPVVAQRSFYEPASFEIEYSLAAEQRVLIEAGSRAWVLPGDDEFIVHYAIPADDFLGEHFNIAVEGGENQTERMRIYSIKFTDRWYGYNPQQGPEGNHLYITPLVGRSSDSGWFIDLSTVFAVPAGFFPLLSVDLPSADMPLGERFAVDTAGRRFETWPYLRRLNIPAGVLAPDEPLSLMGEPSSFR